MVAVVAPTKVEFALNLLIFNWKLSLLRWSCCCCCCWRAFETEEVDEFVDDEVEAVEQLDEVDFEFKMFKLWLAVLGPLATSVLTIVRRVPSVFSLESTVGIRFEIMRVLSASKSKVLFKRLLLECSGLVKADSGLWVFVKMSFPCLSIKWTFWKQSEKNTLKICINRCDR